MTGIMNYTGLWCECTSSSIIQLASDKLIISCMHECQL